MFDFDAASVDEQFQLLAYISDKFDCDSLLFCSGYTRYSYTLEYNAGTLTAIGNDIASDPFAFDPHTLILTVSATNIFLENGISYNGPITMQLCMGGALCQTFTLTYSGCVPTAVLPA